MLTYVIQNFILIIGVIGIISNKNNFMFFLLYIEVIIVIITALIALSFSTENSFFGQIYGLYILTLAAIESAIIITLIIQFYKYRGSISIKIINYNIKN